MDFDPAIAAQQALQNAVSQGELGALASIVLQTEETFSTDQGPEATQAYEQLQHLGTRLPKAKWFQEFLIYITWQQVTEETIPRHFEKGVELCEGFLQRFGPEIEGTQTLRQILDIRESFQSGLGGASEEVMPELDEDSFKGGD